MNCIHYWKKSVICWSVRAGSYCSFVLELIHFQCTVNVISRIHLTAASSFFIISPSYYELQAVLTHKGRSSSSGHYVGWVRQKGDEWLMCDDDEIRPVTSEDVLKLSGGGDWHTAYVLLYRSRVLEMDEEDIQMEKEAAAAALAAKTEEGKEAEGDASMETS